MAPVPESLVPRHRACTQPRSSSWGTRCARPGLPTLTSESGCHVELLSAAAPWPSHPLDAPGRGCEVQAASVNIVAHRTPETLLELAGWAPHPSPFPNSSGPWAVL